MNLPKIPFLTNVSNSLSKNKFAVTIILSELMYCITIIK